jgi:hypothetical protein
MRRDDWLNLNGLWDLAVVSAGAPRPEAFRQQILVPFPYESALSGVGKRLAPQERLWYRRHFQIPAAWKGRRVLLHFGAVDWDATAFVNGREVGTHKGGFDPFSFEITDQLRGGREELVLAVADPTTEGGQPVGKQSLHPEGIWYTPSSGIWQTVWLEPVPSAFIRRIRLIPDVDAGAVRVVAEVDGTGRALTVRAEARAEGREAAAAEGKPGEEITLPIPQANLWTPDRPFLYDLALTLRDQGEAKDSVRSYAALRKISVGKDAAGVTRILLNNRFVFQRGPLDQGFWPDGLYAAPSDDALRFDVEAMKKYGFNMVRKHVKVEPERWYYWCDRLGLMVWQDMPSPPPREPDAGARRQFLSELERIVAARFNHPSIVLWVPFNEGWGQHDTESVVEQVRRWDPTRLVDNASGWTDKGVGDVLDVHAYPGPGTAQPEPRRAAVIGEYGGLGLRVSGHTWAKGGWGYDLFDSKEALTRGYEGLCEELRRRVDDPGVSAAVYTQLTDVESEVNGLLTYDRKVFKIDPAEAAAAHGGYFPPRKVGDADVFVDGTDLELRCQRDGAQVRYTLDGSEPTDSSALYQGPVRLTATTTVKARAFWPADGAASRVVAYTLKQVAPRPSVGARDLAPGLSVACYETPRPLSVLPDFSRLEVAATRVCTRFDLSGATRKENYALRFEGLLTVPATGVYTFYCTSDDGSRLQVGGEVVVDNDGVHGMKEKAGSVALEAGAHPVTLLYFQGVGGQGLKVEYAGPGLTRREVPASALSRRHGGQSVPRNPDQRNTQAGARSSQTTRGLAWPPNRR